MRSRRRAAASGVAAESDGPHLILPGAAINQDGRSSGLTAPSGPAQAALMRDALANASQHPQKVTFWLSLSVFRYRYLLLKFKTSASASTGSKYASISRCCAQLSAAAKAGALGGCFCIVYPTVGFLHL